MNDGSIYSVIWRLNLSELTQESNVAQTYELYMRYSRKIIGYREVILPSNIEIERNIISRYVC